MADKLTLSRDEWNELFPKIQEDLTPTLPRQDLMYGQFVKGRIKYDDKVYDVIGWNFDPLGIDKTGKNIQFELIEV